LKQREAATWATGKEGRSGTNYLLDGWSKPESRLDGEKVQSFCLKAYSDNLMEIQIPEAAQRMGAMRGYHLLRFSILNPARPADIGVGPDPRNLGIGLKALVLH